MSLPSGKTSGISCLVRLPSKPTAHLQVLMCEGRIQKGCPLVFFIMLSQPAEKSYQINKGAGFKPGCLFQEAHPPTPLPPLPPLQVPALTMESNNCSISCTVCVVRNTHHHPPPSTFHVRARWLLTKISCSKDTLSHEHTQLREWLHRFFLSWMFGIFNPLITHFVLCGYTSLPNCSDFKAMVLLPPKVISAKRYVVAILLISSNSSCLIQMEWAVLLPVPF